MTSKYLHKIQYYETDKMQCTHHSNYVRFMEESRVDFLDKIGYSYARMEAENIISPVIAVNLQFKKPTTFDDVIEIEVTVKSFTGIKIEFDYVMKCKGEVVCLASSQHCFIDKNGRPISIKRLRPELFDLFNKLIEN